MSKELIRLVDCTMAFDDEVVLDNITLNIHDKEFLTLLGPSGCGKTTTLRIIGGFQTPTAGDVFFDGVRINAVPAHKRAINTVFQRYALFPHLNVFENIAFGLRIPKAKEERDEKGKVIRRQKVKLTEKEIQERVMEMLDVVNLKGFEKRSVSSLSGGQQQRVAIARALVKMPGVLLLDEPLSNLDARLRLQTREEIRRIQQETGITTVFVTHDQEEAMSICDVIAVMKDGLLMQAGRPQEVYDEPRNLFVAKFLGTPPINVFDGSTRNGQLYIGTEAVLPVPGAADGEVWVGIRPEGFLPCSDGPLSCRLGRVEVMGRDISILSTHSACQGETVRSIINTESSVDAAKETVRFALKPGKVFLFSKDTQERILFDS